MFLQIKLLYEERNGKPVRERKILNGKFERFESLWVPRRKKHDGGATCFDYYQNRYCKTHAYIMLNTMIS